MSALLQDVRFALRNLGKSPVFTATVIATLALASGAVVAIFSLTHAVLLKPLPYREPDRLVRIGHLQAEGSKRPGQSFSPQDYADLEADHPGLDAVAAYSYFPNLTGKNLTGAGEPDRIAEADVSGSFFSLLGVSAFLGRALEPTDDRLGNNHAVVLSYRLWQRRFSGDRSIVGRPILLDEKPYTVVGVMPPTFALPAAEVEVWVPLSTVTDDDVPHERAIRWMSAIGRLSSGASAASARAGIDTLFARLAAKYPESNAGFHRALVAPLSEVVVGDSRPAILVLFGAVALVLLIAAANVANLLLARASAREREVAVRSALGAPRSRIVRQFLTESLLLSLAGGALGLLVASWGINALLAAGGAYVPRAAEVGIDTRVFAFALALSTAVGICFGLAPALAASRVRLSAAMQSAGTRGAAGSRETRRLRELLVVGEITLAAALLFGAGLLARSFWRLTHVDSGLATDSVLSLSITVPESKTADTDEMAAYRSSILEAIRSLPGVTAAGASKTLPLDAGGERYGFTVEGREGAGKLNPESGSLIVSTGYFGALGIPILRGRDFTEGDFSSSAPVLLINQTLARRIFGTQDPIGRGLKLGEFRFEIIGVAGNVRHAGLAQVPGGAIYVPMSRFPRSSLKIFVRSSGDPAALASGIRTAIRRLEPQQPISAMVSLRDLVASDAARPRLLALLVGAFSAAALLLAALGIYGVMSYGVALRTREIGVRMALGADRAAVSRMIVREGMRLAAAGLAAGAAAAWALSRGLSGLLFEVGPADPPTIAAVALFLAGAALAACLVPARRAARLNPQIALRAEG